MVKKTIEIYIAEDGREFQNKQECLNYEQETALSRKFSAYLLEIRDYCNRIVDCDKRCMFYDTRYDRCILYSIPAEWKIQERGE
jgi:hypothetical protein